jgi:hypothetical protein
MSYPRVVYHKDYPFGASDHDREAEAKREKLAKIVKSEEEFKSLGKDWHWSEKHPNHPSASQVSEPAEETSEVKKKKSK